MAAMAGCVREARLGGSRPTDQVIRELREENRELRREVEQLQANIERRLEHIEALEQQLAQTGGTSSAEQLARQPRFTSVRFDRYSGFLDTNRDGVDDTLRLYVLTLDQEGRFLPVSATAVVQVAAVRPGQEPVVLLERTFDVDAFAAAYRTGFLGTHYTLELSLAEAKLPADLDSAVVSVEVKDVATGVTLRRQATMCITTGR